MRERAIALYDTLLQLVRGMRTIRLYHGERLESERATHRASAYLDEMVNAERVRSLATVVMQGLAGVSLVAVIVVGGFQVMRGSLGWPELLAFLMAARASQGPLNNLNNAYLEIQRYGASLVHIDLLLREQPDVRERPDARALPGPPSEVSVEGVSYSVGNVPILHDVSFHVRAGETLGIVGPSGAGKSTLLNLIARVYDPDSGAIRFDGADLRDCRLADVSGAIAMVTQDPFLFATSVRENIRCGRHGAHRRGGGRGRARRRHPRRDRRDAGRLRYADRPGQPRAVARRSAAGHHRARHPQERADPAARRGNVLAGLVGGIARAAGRRPAGRGKTGRRGRAPNFDASQRNPHSRAGRRPRRRTWAPRRGAGHVRDLPAAMGGPGSIR